MVGFPYFFFPYFHSLEANFFPTCGHFETGNHADFKHGFFFTIFDDGKHKKSIFGAVFGADHIAVDAIGEL